jgi:hypothetical protein
LILLLPAFSPLFPVPKNRFSLVKLLPDWNTFWPCFAAGFFLFFYPFRLPSSIFLICTKVTSLLLLPAFTPFLLSRETRTADNVPNGKRLSCFNFAVNSLSFPILLNYLFATCFPASELVLILLLPTFSLLSPCPEGRIQFGALLSVWLPFQIHLYRCLLSGFLAEWAPMW